jgi:hypothetical protein
MAPPIVAIESRSFRRVKSPPLVSFHPALSLSASLASLDPLGLTNLLLTCSPSLGALVVCEQEKPNFPSYLSIKCLISVPLPTPLGPQTTSAAGGRCEVEVEEVGAFWSPSGEEAAAPIVGPRGVFGPGERKKQKKQSF